MSHSRTAASPLTSILTWRSQSRPDLRASLAQTLPRSVRGDHFLTPTDFRAVYKARLDNRLARIVRRTYATNQRLLHPPFFTLHLITWRQSQLPLLPLP